MIQPALAILPIVPTYAAVTAPTQIAQGITLLVVGMGVVFAVLVLLALLITVLNTQPKPEPAAAPVSHPDSASASNAIPPEHLVASAAASQAALGPRARVSRGVFLGHSGQRDWVAGGRATVMGSHAPSRATRSRS